jgi:hypothetical protein
VDSGFDNVFHQKVASETSSEVILFTNKLNSKVDCKNPMDFLRQKSILNKNLSQSDIQQINESIPRSSRSISPSYVIEFDAENKLEIVPKKQKESYQKDKSKFLAINFDR